MCSKWEQKLFVANSHISSWRTPGEISLSNASSFCFPRQYIYFRCAKSRMRERRFDATAHTYTHKEARVIAPKDARRQSDRRLQFVLRDPLSPRCLDFIFKFYLYASMHTYLRYFFRGVARWNLIAYICSIEKKTTPHDYILNLILQQHKNIHKSCSLNAERGMRSQYLCLRALS